MAKLTKEAIRVRRTYGRTNPNYKKASLLKTILGFVYVKCTKSPVIKGNLV